MSFKENLKSGKDLLARVFRDIRQEIAFDMFGGDFLFRDPIDAYLRDLYEPNKYKMYIYRAEEWARGASWNLEESRKESIMNCINLAKGENNGEIDATIVSNLDHIYDCFEPVRVRMYLRLARYPMMESNYSKAEENLNLARAHSHGFVHETLTELAIKGISLWYGHKKPEKIQLTGFVV